MDSPGTLIGFSVAMIVASVAYRPSFPVQPMKALGAKSPGPDKINRFIVLTAAAFLIWNVGIAVLFSVSIYHVRKRGRLCL